MPPLPDLSDLLPGFSAWRENQQEVVQDVLDDLVEADTVLIDAPTGAGKTIIGAATARGLGLDGSVPDNALYLAHTIVLQKQQLQTLPNAVTATGRRNHECLRATHHSDDAERLGAAEDALALRFPEFSAEDAGDLGWCDGCEYASRTGCSYYRQWFETSESKDAVLNYAYITRVAKTPVIKVSPGEGTTGPDANLLPNPFVNRSLMVCDEGHNLEAAILSAASVEVNDVTFDRLGFQVPDSTDITVWLSWALHVLPHVQAMADDAKKSGRMSRNDVRRMRQTRSAVNALQGIIELSQAQDGTVYVGKKSDTQHVVQPIWAWNIADRILFKHADKQVIMSATLGDHKLAARLLGLNSWTSVSIPSTFPVENRPVVYWPVSKMSYNTPDQQKALQGLALSWIARKFPDQPGVVHCNSYALGKFLRDIIDQVDPETGARTMLVEDSSQREAVHAAFERNAYNHILITPAATTGVDWDFVHWQMIPKIPYPDLSDAIVRLRKEYIAKDGEEIGSQVYIQEAIKVLVQACGRNVRTPKSKGINIITDAGFWALFKYIAPDQFPDWFKSAVRFIEGAPDLEEYLEELRRG